MDPKTGRCAILFPHGVLFRNEELDMRQRIVGNDLVEAVIGLGPNLFYNSPMESCIVICRAKKPAERAGKVLFVDAVNEVTRERAQSFLTDEHIDRVVHALRAFEFLQGFVAVATLDEIANRDGNLSISLYVERPGTHKERDLEATLDQWRRSSDELRSAADALLTCLDESAAV